MKILLQKALTCAALVLCGTKVAHAVEAPFSPDPYNVIWDSPSKDYNGSMPIGNGDLAANVWVEPSGDLVFYVSKSDSWTGGRPDPELV